jgi:small GTP-binding protein
MDYYSILVELADGSIINAHLRDTCGQERYDSINANYAKKADGILLVFDISSLNSFKKIKEYYPELIRNNCKHNIPILLLGNKTDLKDERQVSVQEAIDLAVSEEYVYKETSCVNNENVADAFETIIEMWNINHKTEKLYIPQKSLTTPNFDDESNNSFKLNSSDLTVSKRDDDEDYFFLQVKKKKKKSCC